MPTDKRSRERRKARKVNVERRLKEHKTSFDRTSIKVPDGVPFFQPKKAGVYRLEIIPFEVTDSVKKFDKNVVFAEPGEFYWEQTYWSHFGVGPNNDAFVCPRMQCGKKCPICEFRAKEMSKPEGDEETIKSLAPKQRQLFLVYNHDEDARGVQLWDVSYHLFGKHLETAINTCDPEDREAYLKFVDEDEGMTLRVTATEEPNPRGKHLEFGRIEFRERKEKLDSELYDKAPSLDSLIIVRSYDDLKKVFLQEESQDEDDDETESRVREAEEAEDDEDALSQDQDQDGDEGGVAEIEMGDRVKHKRYGVCTVTRVTADGTSLSLKDKEGAFHRNVGLNEVVKVEDEPAARPGRTPTRRPAVEEEEEDDIEFADSELEEDTTEPTRGRPPKPQPKPQPVEEDDEFLDEEDEDEATDNGRAGKKPGKPGRKPTGRK